MIQADTDTTTNHPDASLLEMGRLHDQIYAEWDGLDDDDPRIGALCAESIELAHRILIFPVRTDVGSAEKRRIVATANLEVESNHFVGEETGSDFVEFIYRLDADRIAAAD